MRAVENRWRSWWAEMGMQAVGVAGCLPAQGVGGVGPEAGTGRKRFDYCTLEKKKHAE